jgi:hypothetical protein
VCPRGCLVMPDLVTVPETCDGHAQAILQGLLDMKATQELAELFLDQDDYFGGNPPYGNAIHTTARVVLNEITSANGCSEWDIDYAIKHARELCALVQLSQLEDAVNRDADDA